MKFEPNSLATFCNQMDERIKVSRVSKDNEVMELREEVERLRGEIRQLLKMVEKLEQTIEELKW